MYPLLSIFEGGAEDGAQRRAAGTPMARLASLLGQYRGGLELEESLCEALDLLPLHCVLARRAGRQPSTAAIHGYMQALAENLPLRGALEDATAALVAAGIQTIVYKGQDYVERIYGELGGRAMADVDLLIRPQDLPRATRALERAGFRADRGTPREHETKFCKQGMAIDLHHALLQPARMAIDHEELFARALPCRFLDGAFVLEDTDALLVHCVNQTVKGYHLPASSYLELEALLARADGKQAIGRAARFRACSALYTSLRMLADLGNPRAERLQRAIPLPRARRAVLDRLVASFARRSFLRPRPSRATLLAIKTTLIDHPGDAVRFVPRWCAWALPLRGPP